MSDAESDVSREAQGIERQYGRSVLRDHAVSRYRAWLTYARVIGDRHAETHYAQRSAYLWGQVHAGRWP